MAKKQLTPAEVVDRLAKKTGLTVEQVKSLLAAQAELACANADAGWPIPGIGVLASLYRAPRKLVLQWGEDKGKVRTIPPSRRAKFRLSRRARDIVSGRGRPSADLFQSVPLPSFEFSAKAQRLSDPAEFIAGMEYPFTTAEDDPKPATTVFYQLPHLHLPTGRILASDIFVSGCEPFARAVAPGRYPLALAALRVGVVERVVERIALAIIRFSDKAISKWEVAVLDGRRAPGSRKGGAAGYGVDSATGSFCDASVQPLVALADGADVGFQEKVIDEMEASYELNRKWVHLESPNGSLAVFSSGYGDGFYPSYFGLDRTGAAAILVTDFGLVNWAPLTKA